MQIKGFFANRSALFHLGVLLYLILIGLLLNTFVGYYIISISNLLSGNATENKSFSSFYTLHAVQFASSLLIILLPALLTAYFCNKKPGEFLSIQKITDARILILSLVMILLLSPLIEITSYLNSNILLPEFMAPIEDWMRKKEEFTAKTTEILLSKEGFLPYMTNILIIGVMAGLTEELLFRGALMSIIRKKIKNPHIAIWIIAFIFSAIHLQFYGFIPRILLGAYMGYLLYWTRNIWVPVFAHFINNTIVIAGYKTGLFQFSSGNSSFTTTDMEANELYATIAVAVIGIILFVICAKIMKKLTKQAINH